MNEKERREFWRSAYLAERGRGNSGGQATTNADWALAEYDKRFARGESYREPAEQTS